MTRLSTLTDHPRYTVARGLGRFAVIRQGITGARHLALRSRTATFEAEQRARLHTTSFLGVDIARSTRELNQVGLAEGFILPDVDVAAIREYADNATVYADRLPHRGFRLDQRDEAERVLGKPILVAQYLNAQRDCPVIDRLANDPVLGLVASSFLGSVPRLVGSSLWWTFPVDATAEDRDLHAHRYHRDLDDFAFVKFFFYLTPVASSDGAHVCVAGSQHDSLGVGRFDDAEIEARFPADAIREITGPAGAGFAENTFCIHKGLTPTRTARLLLQFEFALFDYGVTSDRHDDVRTLPM